MRRAIAPHRAFDPRRVGTLETTAWVTYYRREWPRFLRAAVGLTRHTFGLPWPQTIYGARLVLRANQLWAPFPDNDPDGARRCMARFYALVARRYSERIDAGRASVLEVERWRVQALAMRYSDQWVNEGCDMASPLIGLERAALVRSYAGLLSAVHRPPGERGEVGQAPQ